jgi:CRISPR-associated protein Cmr4
MGNALLVLHALTPVHTGTGQAVDVVDLPVAREKVTGWPVIPASSIKGVLRDACCSKDPRHGKAFGGPDPGDAPEGGSTRHFAGNLLFSDGRLLCFPVRSFAGVFAWTTCPSALERLARDCRAARLEDPPRLAGPKDLSSVLVTESTRLRDSGDRVILEEFDLKVADPRVDELAKDIASRVFEDENWRESFVSRFAVLHDDLFTTLTETATEVVARVALMDETKTVRPGALWYEEAVPAESIFVCPLIDAGRNGDDLVGWLADQTILPVQIGGNATVGRGLMRLVLNGRELRGGGEG